MSVRQLPGTTAIVTGASRGFGRAIATSFASHGAHVIGVARNEAGLIDVHRELGEAFQFEVADATEPLLPEQLFSRHHPNIVVLNAGASPVIGPLDEQSWEGFSTNWSSDVRQVFNFARASLLAPLAPGAVALALCNQGRGASEVARFIDRYNTTRRHSSCEMHPPIDYEQILVARASGDEKAA